MTVNIERFANYHPQAAQHHRPGAGHELGLVRTVDQLVHDYPAAVPVRVDPQVAHAHEATGGTIQTLEMLPMPGM